jgi:hypothetical protein
MGYYVLYIDPETGLQKRTRMFESASEAQRELEALKRIGVKYAYIVHAQQT